MATTRSGDDEAAPRLSKTERRRAVRQRKKDQELAETIQRKRAKNEAKKRRRANKRRSEAQSGGGSVEAISYEERRTKFMKKAGFDVKKLQGKRCFACLGRHFLKDCPEKSTIGGSGAGLCFNCGSTEHALAKCPLSVNMENLPHARCFMCKAQGHITRFCPKNANGIYPKGGECHHCGGKTHLSKDCPDRAAGEDRVVRDDEAAVVEGVGVGNARTRGDDDGALQGAEPKKKKAKRANIVKF